MERTCENCKYENVCCYEYSDARRNAETCKVYEENKPITNGDAIRVMSDEELAEFINKVKFCGGLIRTETTSSECHGCKDGICCNVLAWLRQPRKVEK